jgi:hypothetical protein
MEKILKPTNGYLALVLSLVFMAIAIYSFVQIGGSNQGVYAIPAIVSCGVCLFIWKGLMIV